MAKRFFRSVLAAAVLMTLAGVGFLVRELATGQDERLELSLLCTPTPPPEGVEEEFFLPPQPLNVDTIEEAQELVEFTLTLPASVPEGLSFALPVRAHRRALWDDHTEWSSKAGDSPRRNQY